MVSAIPEGYPQLSPYLVVDDAAAAIDFYCKALGATEIVRMPAPGGKVGHAEVKIGSAVVMLADESPDMGALSAKTVGGTPVTLALYVDDVDKIYAQAIEAGATPIGEGGVSDQFYGDRVGQFADPFGHKWHVATHTEDVTPEEMERRVAEQFGGGSPS